MKGLVIRDISVRSSQAFNEDVDHESQEEIGKSSTVNPSNAPNQAITVVPLPIRATRGPNKQGRTSQVGWVQLHKNPICAQLSIRIGQKCQMNLRNKYGILFSQNRFCLKSLLVLEFTKNEGACFEKQEQSFQANKCTFWWFKKLCFICRRNERADVYVKLHLHKDGTPVNTVAEGNIEKINELLSESSSVW
nr:hypothetical protein CFP56_24721 [Quercus suber]